MTRLGICQDGSSASRSRADRAYFQLRQRILGNELPAGTQLLEQEVADLLEMSRTPVREALVRLADDGLVDLRPRHGMRVLPISAGDMDEIYEILTSLEVTAIRKLANRGATDQEIAGLAAAVDAMDAALADDDLLRWAQADDAFHELLVASAGNRRLNAIVSALSDQAHRARLSTLALRPAPSASNADHRAVVEAIRAQDADRAARLHGEHRKSSRALLVRLLETIQTGTNQGGPMSGGADRGT